jgi:anti-sigma regulatory factor (Ser/Thr protein kinase)
VIPSSALPPIQACVTPSPNKRGTTGVALVLLVMVPPAGQLLPTVLSQSDSSLPPIGIHVAHSIAEATERLAQTEYAVVITDSELSDGDGFSVLRHAKQAQPTIKTGLMTANPIYSYIGQAHQQSIHTIMVKEAPFNLDELTAVINGLLRPTDRFGLACYMMPDTPITQLSITNSEQIMDVFNALKTFFEVHQIAKVNDLCTALIEAMTNAVYHVAKTDVGRAKYTKGQVIPALEPNEYVTISFAADQRGVGVAITDQGGCMTAQDILYWLNRNLSGEALLDTHGRGMFLMHTLVDRFIINLDPGHATQLVLLQAINGAFHPNKPLYIHTV